MRTLIALALIAAPLAVAEHRAKDWAECRQQDIYPSNCIGLLHFFTLADGIRGWYASQPKAQPPAPAPPATQSADFERKAREVREYWERYEQDQKARRESSLASAWAEIDAAKRQSASQAPVTQPAPAKRERRQVYTESTTRIGGYLYTTTSDGRQCTSWRQGLDWVTQCY